MHISRNDFLSRTDGVSVCNISPTLSRKFKCHFSSVGSIYSLRLVLSISVLLNPVVILLSIMLDVILEKIKTLFGPTKLFTS
jgi:hypothetical protein